MDQKKSRAPWYAVQVRARSEKLVAYVLQNKGFEYLLPLYSIDRQRSDRVVEQQLPLFPGYLFCRLDLNSRLLPLFTTPGVLRLLGVGHTPAPVDDSEIDAVQAILKAGGSPRPWPMPKEGERVRIGAGPLCGVEGIFVGHKKNSRLVVSVTLLQRAIAVEVEADWARPIQSQPRGRIAEPYVGTSKGWISPANATPQSVTMALVGSTPTVEQPF
jgi:transcription antitermination factor NusG